MRATAHCLDSIQFGASEGPNPAGRLDVSIVSIRFDLGPLPAWGPPDVSMSRLSRFDSIWALWRPGARRTSRCLDCLDSAGFGPSGGLGPTRRLDVSIVSIRFDLGPLPAWGPPVDCLDSIQFGASEGPNPAGRLDVSIVSIRLDLGPRPAGIGIYGIWHTISVSLSYPFARLT